MNPEMQAALAPFLTFIETNDTDTLARTCSDDTVVATATHSWRDRAPVTLGDFRRLAAAVHKLHGQTPPFSDEERKLCDFASAEMRKATDLHQTTP